VTITVKLAQMVVLLTMALLPVLAPAQDIPQSCLQSFNVKNKSFVTGNATMSCVLLEKRRGEMSAAINKLDAAGAIDGPAVAQQLAVVNGKLLKAENEVNWSGWGLSLSGNFMSTLGLASCAVPTPGCWLAVVGKVMSMAAIVDTAADDAARRKASAQVRAEVDALQKKVAAANPAMGPTRSQLVKESIQMCEAVRQQCL
jgi:hypothetical protein